jgi:methylated-DNA-[protein]-cysteine S-methyltransferase
MAEPKMMLFKMTKTPIGRLTLITRDEKLAFVHFEENEDIKTNARLAKSDPLLASVSEQLDKYFKSKLFRFSVPVQPHGTPFQLKVWEALTHIPYGKTWSYGEQAHHLGDAKKARAVGMANGRNPIPIIIPCHRVIGKNGDLTGFGGGLEIKRFLLDLECENRANNWHPKPMNKLANWAVQ